MGTKCRIQCLRQILQASPADAEFGYSSQHVKRGQLNTETVNPEASAGRSSEERIGVESSPEDTTKKKKSLTEWVGLQEGALGRRS